MCEKELTTEEVASELFDALEDLTYELGKTKEYVLQEHGMQMRYFWENAQKILDKTRNQLSFHNE